MTQIEINLFFNKLKESNNKKDEYEIGESLGFTSEKTKDIINYLLEKGKIEEQSFGICSYNVIN